MIHETKTTSGYCVIFLIEWGRGGRIGDYEIFDIVYKHLFGFIDGRGLRCFANETAHFVRALGRGLPQLA